MWLHAVWLYVRVVVCLCGCTAVWLYICGEAEQPAGASRAAHSPACTGASRVFGHSYLFNLGY